MPDILIVKLNSTHLNSVMSMVRAAIEDMESKNIFQWDDIYPTEEIITADLNAGSVYGLFTGEKISAFVVVNEIQHFMYETIFWKYSKPLVIHRLTVHPEYQGRGYAKELVTFAEKIAEENQYDSIRLDAFIPNHVAVRLYESSGYEKRGVIRFRKGDFYAMEKLVK